MEKILVIDDDEMDLQMLSVLCTSVGYEVIKTADGPQGLDLYRQHMPTLVFLDLGLPTQNGMDVLRDIKRLDANSKVVLITGYGSEKVAKDAFDLGALDFIEKTWDIGMMMERVRMVLNAYGSESVS